MLTMSLLAATMIVTPALRPRECASCGAYAGPNAFRVLDPYLRQVDIWPEFYAATCRFEVSRGAFVTLNRASCAAEVTYRGPNR
ncbi:MAG: hypothetical protein H7066_03085 [Cytophagaceae bacterium]|nr:hypothetical protein [Gemmatimonadaceae bacterium]